MSNEQHQDPLPKGQTAEATAVENDKPAAAPQSISIQDILNTYPIDRDKCRDVLLVEMSRSLGRVADTLEAMSQGLIVANTHLSALVKKQTE